MTIYYYIIIVMVYMKLIEIIFTFVLSFNWLWCLNLGNVKVVPYLAIEKEWQIMTAGIVYYMLFYSITSSMSVLVQLIMRTIECIWQDIYLTVGMMDIFECVDLAWWGKIMNVWHQGQVSSSENWISTCHCTKILGHLLYYDSWQFACVLTLAISQPVLDG